MHTHTHTHMHTHTKYLGEDNKHCMKMQKNNNKNKHIGNVPMYRHVLTKTYQIKPIAWVKIASSASKCNKIQYVNIVLKRHTPSKECWTHLREESCRKRALASVKGVCACGRL